MVISGGQQAPAVTRPWAMAAGEALSDLQPGRYVNTTYGFSVQCGPELTITDHAQEPGELFRKKAPEGGLQFRTLR